MLHDGREKNMFGKKQFMGHLLILSCPVLTCSVKGPRGNWLDKCMLTRCLGSSGCLSGASESRSVSEAGRI